MDLNIEAIASIHQELVAALQDVRSTKELFRHPRFRSDREVIDRSLNTPQVFKPKILPSPKPRGAVRFQAWNVERGIAFDEILKTLREHSVASDWDVLLLTEVDHGMARSRNRHVAKELGEALGCYTVFGPAFLNLDFGNGAEKELASGNANTVALQGHAILSRYPIHSIQLIPLPNPKDHVATKERQIGSDQAILATIDTPFGPLHTACVHLSAHSARDHRVLQMGRILDAVKKREGPALIGGDWNTTTYNAHRATRAILGFWRRVAMGVHHVMRNHYPYPENFFERKLFKNLEANGFEISDFNVPGGCTLHYDFNDPYVRASLEDWVPRWCFPFIDRALRPHNGKCSFKLDWFAGREVVPERPLIVSDLPQGEHRYSDHDPILIDVKPRTAIQPAS